MAKRIADKYDTRGAPKEQPPQESERSKERGALNGSLLKTQNAHSEFRAWGEGQFPPLNGRVVRALTDTALDVSSSRTSSTHARVTTTAATTDVSANVMP